VRMDSLPIPAWLSILSAASLRLLVAACLTMPFQSIVARADTPVAIGARVSGDGSRSRFVADLSEPVSYSVYVLPDPYRVVIDLPEVKFQMPTGVGRKVTGLVQEYRFGQVQRGRSRIVIDVFGPVLIDKSFVVPPQGEQPARIVVDLVSTDNATFLKTHLAEQDRLAKASEAEDLADGSVSTNPSVVGLSDKLASTPDNGESGAQFGTVPLPKPKPGRLAEKPEPVGAPEPAHKERRVVVLDPGHGGIDPGAIGISKTKEKDVVLAFAIALRDKLKSSGKFDVVMTRDKDRFVTLKERVRIARRAHADLFIAIHADKVRGPTARGATVYTLSEKASDAEAEALAQKENLADVIGGVDLGEEKEEITDILIDLTQRETKNHSMAFAKRAVRELKPKTLMTGRPMRSAGFVVLKAPDIPSILLELGYLSSKPDETLLNSDVWRTKVAEAMASAIEGYMGLELAQRQ
jgi:N-acetylmuramoyl-L-alanine amidase